jgi:hypothetical protein
MLINGVGDSEKVTVNVNSSITTSGIASHGVIAMSLAGGVDLQSRHMMGFMRMAVMAQAVRDLCT